MTPPKKISCGGRGGHFTKWLHLVCIHRGLMHPSWCMFLICTYKQEKMVITLLALSQVRIYRTPPPPPFPSELIQFPSKMRTVINRVDSARWILSFFYADYPHIHSGNFYFLSYACIYNLIKTYRPKKIVHSGQIYRKDAHCTENYFLSSWVFFCAT